MNKRKENATEYRALKAILKRQMLLSALQGALHLELEFLELVYFKQFRSCLKQNRPFVLNATSFFYTVFIIRFFYSVI